MNQGGGGDRSVQLPRPPYPRCRTPTEVRLPEVVPGFMVVVVVGKKDTSWTWMYIQFTFYIYIYIYIIYYIYTFILYILYIISHYISHYIISHYILPPHFYYYYYCYCCSFYFYSIYILSLNLHYWRSPRLKNFIASDCSVIVVHMTIKTSWILNLESWIFVQKNKINK